MNPINLYMGLEYREPEEVVYDDKFSISIIDLIHKHKPETPRELKYLLNTNGYYGRYNMLEIYRGGHSTKEIKIVVEMVWSKYKYTWPYKGTYSFMSAQVLRMRELRPLDVNMGEALDNLLASYGRSVNRRGFREMSQRSEMNIRLLLEETKVLTSEGFHLNNKTDIKEYKYNVLGLKKL